MDLLQGFGVCHVTLAGIHALIAGQSTALVPNGCACPVREVLVLLRAPHSRQYRFCRLSIQTAGRHLVT